MPIPSAGNSYNAYAYPSVVLRVGGNGRDDLGQPAQDILDNMVSFEYHDHLRKADMAIFVIADPERRFSNDIRFEADTPWTFRFGYPADFSAARQMRLKYFEPRYEEDGAVVLRVTLMGNATEMIRVKSARNWGSIPSSEIAQKLASKYGWSAVVDESNDASEAPFVQAADVSDFAFLHILASEIDFEFFVEGKTLYYRSRDLTYNEAPRMTLIYYGDGEPTLLKSFQPVIKATRPSKVKARSVNTKDGKPANAGVTNKNVKGTHLGDLPTQCNLVDPDSAQTATTKPGDAVERIQAEVIEPLKQEEKLKRIADQFQVNVANGQAILIKAPKAVLDDAAADSVVTQETNKQKVSRIAAARKRHFLDASVKASCVVVGTPRMRAKATFEFHLPDPRLSGNWYCTEAVHKISGSFYETSAQLKRGAYKAKKARKGPANASTQNNKKCNPGAPSVAKLPTVLINVETGEADMSTRKGSGVATAVPDR